MINLKNLFLIYFLCLQPVKQNETAIDNTFKNECILTNFNCDNPDNRKIIPSLKKKI